MSELERLIHDALVGKKESPAKQERAVSTAIVPVPEEESALEGSVVQENAVVPMNPAYHLAGELMDKVKGYLVKDPSDSKYQVARELVSVVKSNNGKLSDAMIIEVGALIAYKGISYGLDWLKNYFDNKRK